MQMVKGWWSSPRQRLCTALLLGLLALAWLIVATFARLLPLPADLRPQSLAFNRPQFLDRNGIPLSVTFDNPWNVHDWLPLHEIPSLLQHAVLASEDQRFFQHHGIDWRARAHALAQNLRAFRGVRGASSISEQVVRILHPRPRTLWSRWLEGIEAIRLSQRFSKIAILEFYLNQVPYSHQRRGVLQASRLYFDRDLDTLTPTETLTLAILIRAPGRLARQARSGPLDTSLQRLSQRLLADGRLHQHMEKQQISGQFSFAPARLATDTGHFIRYLTESSLAEPASSKDDDEGGSGRTKILTTLESVLQAKVQNILDQQLNNLHSFDVHNGAALVIDHRTDEILAWVNSHDGKGEGRGVWLDAVTSPRQPGSTLKPFLYALALDRGWTAATLIDDSPLARPVGDGLHPFRNYSRQHYGPLRLREALGNSLNIPAIRAIQFTGVEDFLHRLQSMGMTSLQQNGGYYGEGLALGNGEVTLLELVRSYTVLARGGTFHPLRLTLNGKNLGPGRHRVYSEEAASLVADILSDPQARRREFGTGNILNLPVQTAVKTGTSNDHRDAWAVGFNHAYTVGIWMGNLDGHASKGLTGTTGPGLVLRSIFAELNRFTKAEPLRQSPRLAVARVCALTGHLAGPSCPTVLEKFMVGTLPHTPCREHSTVDNTTTFATAATLSTPPVHILQPSPNLLMAMDPHIPDHIEAYPMKLSAGLAAERVEWLLDGHLAGITGSTKEPFMWPLQRGSHLAQARIRREDIFFDTPEVRFTVK